MSNTLSNIHNNIDGYNKLITFYAKHKEDISELIKIIEQEIQEIKLNIGFDS